MTIGPAGENLVRFASVSNDYSRQAARGGSGAVLGSKKVKAIAIRGSRDIPLANHSSFLRAVEKANRIIFENPWVPLQRRYGTPRSVSPVNAAGLLPVNNFAGGDLESVEEIDEVAWEKLTVKRLSCGECPVACAKGYARDNISLEGPEYETIALFGPNLGITDPAAIAEFNYYCNQYGMDTISAGALLGAYFASGLPEAGKHKKPGRGSPGSQTGRMASRQPPSRQPPSRRTIIELLGDIAYRRGIGHTLARGLRSAGEELKITHLMPEIKGLGLPAYDPRGTDGTALVYMTADRGACHLRSWPLGRELSGEIDKDDPSAVVAFVKKQQDEKAAEESLIVCQFAYGIGLLNGILAELVDEATGEDWDLEKMRLAGERSWNISRLFNNREGITRKDDYLPEKFAVEGIAAGPLKGRKVDREKQDLLLDEYYRRRGWTKEGIPEPAVLKRLGIEGII
jgi:aldehyde:ferredoxin oxidoreductase